MDGGAWWAIAHGVEKSQTQLSDFTFLFVLTPAGVAKPHGRKRLADTQR